MSIFLGLLTCPCSDFCPKWWVLSPSKDPCIVTSSARKSLVRLWTPWIFHQIWVVIAVNKSNKFSQFLPTNPSVAEFSNPLSFLDKFGRFAPPPLGVLQWGVRQCWGQSNFAPAKGKSLNYAIIQGAIGKVRVPFQIFQAFVGLLFCTAWSPRLFFKSFTWAFIACKRFSCWWKGVPAFHGPHDLRFHGSTGKWSIHDSSGHFYYSPLTRSAKGCWHLQHHLAESNCRIRHGNPCGAKVSPLLCALRTYYVNICSRTHCWSIGFPIVWLW